MLPRFRAFARCDRPRQQAGGDGHRRRCVGRAGRGITSAPAGGPIHVFVQPGNGQGNGKILITGAIGDYGATHKASGGGGKTYATATLKKGTITFDLTIAITAKANHGTPTFDKATCSALRQRISSGSGCQRNWALCGHPWHRKAHGVVRFHRLDLQERFQEGKVQVSTSPLPRWPRWARFTARAPSASRLRTGLARDRQTGLLCSSTRHAPFRSLNSLGTGEARQHVDR